MYKPTLAQDKRILQTPSMPVINQLMPFKYPWAWDFYLNANNNHWLPLDVDMTQDIHDYVHTLTTAERHLVSTVLAYLSTADVMAMRNIGLAVMDHMGAPELQMYQARQVYEESLHTWSYQHCAETLRLDTTEVYNRYRTVPSLAAKIEMAQRRLTAVTSTTLNFDKKEDVKTFLLSYIFFAALFEGTWFYNGFTPIFALQRRGLMKGTAEQLQYIMRDEVLHCAFGIRVAKTIMQENDLMPDAQDIQNMWDEGRDLEKDYANHLFSKGELVGYDAETHLGQYEFLANRRSKQLGLPQPYPKATNTIPWLDEQANLRKEKNFFETRVTEYQSSPIDWST